MSRSKRDSGGGDGRFFTTTKKGEVSGLRLSCGVVSQDERERKRRPRNACRGSGGGGGAAKKIAYSDI